MDDGDNISFEDITFILDSDNDSRVNANDSKRKVEMINGSGTRKFKTLVKKAFDNPAFEHCEPEICLQMMKQPTMKSTVALKKQIQNNDTKWVQSFLEEGGLCLLLDCVGSLSTGRVRQLSDALLLLEVIQCVKEVVNCKVGLEYLIQSLDFTQKLTYSKILIVLIVVSKY